MENFDVDKYLGTWYQMYRVNSSTDFGDCSYAKYYKEYNNKIKLENTVFPRKF